MKYLLIYTLVTGQMNVHVEAKFEQASFCKAVAQESYKLAMEAKGLGQLIEHTILKNCVEVQ